MIRTTILLFTGLALSGIANADRPMRFDAHLQGFNAGGVPVATNATGQARVEVIDDGTAIYFQIEVAGVENLLMAHIHVKPGDEPVLLNEPAGPVRYWFVGGPPPGGTVSGPINGSLARGFIITDADLSDMTVEGMVEAIRENRASIIVHTGDNPAGLLRGTLR